VTLAALLVQPHPSPPRLNIVILDPSLKRPPNEGGALVTGKEAILVVADLKAGSMLVKQLPKIVVAAIDVISPPPTFGE
jgi:hypothetical protein